MGIQDGLGLIDMKACTIIVHDDLLRERSTFNSVRKEDENHSQRGWGVSGMHVQNVKRTHERKSRQLIILGVEGGTDSGVMCLQVGARIAHVANESLLREKVTTCTKLKIFHPDMTSQSSGVERVEDIVPCHTPDCSGCGWEGC